MGHSAALEPPEQDDSRCDTMRDITSSKVVAGMIAVGKREEPREDMVVGSVEEVKVGKSDAERRPTLESRIVNIGSRLCVWVVSGDMMAKSRGG